jgi:hypothetical protein
MSSPNNPDLVGGGGGNYFSSTPFTKKVKTVNIRSGKYIDSIQLVYSSNLVIATYGGTGGEPGSFTVAAGDEVIVAVQVKYGKYVDGLQFITNKGVKSPWFGGSGLNKGTGIEDFGTTYVAKSITFNAPAGTFLVGIQGRCGGYLDAFAPIWGTDP